MFHGKPRQLTAPRKPESRLDRRARRAREFEVVALWGGDGDTSRTSQLERRGQYAPFRFHRTVLRPRGATRQPPLGGVGVLSDHLLAEVEDIHRALCSRWCVWCPVSITGRARDVVGTCWSLSTELRPRGPKRGVPTEPPGSSEAANGAYAALVTASREGWCWPRRQRRWS